MGFDLDALHSQFPSNGGGNGENRDHLYRDYGVADLYGIKNEYDMDAFLRTDFITKQNEYEKEFNKLFNKIQSKKALLSNAINSIEMAQRNGAMSAIYTIQSPELAKITDLENRLAALGRRMVAYTEIMNDCITEEIEYACDENNDFDFTRQMFKLAILAHDIYADNMVYLSNIKKEYNLLCDYLEGEADVVAEDRDQKHLDSDQ